MPRAGIGMKRIFLDTNFYDDLDHLAGTWSKKDAAEFERATAVFGKVDEDLWK